MRGAISISIAMTLALGLSGCAAVFRDSKPTVHVESDPPGASVRVSDAATAPGAAPEQPTPFDVPVKRTGLTDVRVNMPGFEEHHGTLRKHINGLWLTADLATCIIPVFLCVPLLTDAISGAWYDVEPRYRAHLVPLANFPLVAAYPPAAPPPAPPRVVTPATPPQPTISDSERKAAARAAFQEGMELQAKQSYAEALGRFQSAQRMFDAPTHHLHIAQCLVATGKLVEAQESYETLTHRELAADAPAPFKEAVDIGRRELGELRPRIPTLRIVIVPAPSTLRNLALALNGHPLPNEVIGIARPINPGTYRVTATASGIAPSKPVDVTLAETDQRSVEIRLGR